MDFSIPFNKAWAVYKKNFVDMTVGYLLMLVISILTLGLLFPGLFYGYKMMLLKALRGKKITPNEIFAGLTYYWSLGGLFLYAGIILALLCVTIVGIVPAIAIGTWWMYAGLFIVDKKYSISNAMLASKNIVRKNNVWLHVVFLIILSIVGNVGVSIACVGGLITLPYSLVVFCAAYEAESKTK